MSNTVLRATGPLDLIACVPPILGFHPEESIVMLTTAGASFHARLDIPGARRDWEDAATALLSPCRQHGVQGVVLLLFSNAPDTSLGEYLASRWAHVGIAVHDVVYVKPDAYLATSRPASDWTAYDLQAHPNTLEAALAGHGPQDRTRADLVERVRPGAAPVVYGESDLNTVSPISVADLIEQTHGARGAAGLLASVLKALTDPEWIDDLITSVDEAHRCWMLDVFIEVLRAAQPHTLHAHRAAEVAAYLAWWNGNGAIANTCLEHCDPSSHLATLLHHAVNSAVNPAQWDPSRI